MEQNEWFDEGVADEIGQVDEYDIISSPNDFNLLTLQSFVEAGAIKIPGFQRNYVWDKQRASKLIESLIIGIPVPQLFLYEESKQFFSRRWPTKTNDNLLFLQTKIPKKR